MNIVVGVQGESNLFHVIAALRSPRRFAGSLDGRQQQGNQNANDGDHNQQFDQREATTMR